MRHLTYLAHVTYSLEQLVLVVCRISADCAHRQPREARLKRPPKPVAQQNLAPAIRNVDSRSTFLPSQCLLPQYVASSLSAFWICPIAPDHVYSLSTYAPFVSFFPKTRGGCMETSGNKGKVRVKLPDHSRAQRCKRCPKFKQGHRGY